MYRRQNFCLVQAESISRRQIKCYLKYVIRFHVVEKIGEKQKMLVSSIFSFSYIVFNMLFPERRQKSPLPGKVLTLSQTSPGFYVSAVLVSLLKTLWEKEKLLLVSNFSFSHSVFYPFGELSAIFIKFEIVVCKLFQFGRV